MRSSQNCLIEFCIVSGVLLIVILPAIVGLASAASVPIITVLSPSGGPVTGGTVVTITGSGFTGTKDVLFGGKSVNGLNIINDSQLTVITPQHPEERVLISIITAEGVPGFMEPFTMFQYSYEKFPLPRLSGISPSSGPASGGTVRITGSGFTGTKEVLFGKQPGAVLDIVDDSHLTVSAPFSFFPGSVPVSIRNARGFAGSLDPVIMYTYDYPLPELTGISPSSGSIAGGTVVTLTGSGFAGTENVQFGEKYGTGLNVIDNWQLTILTPPSSEGIVGISVSNPAGTGRSSGAATMFHYEVPVPKLTGISPSSGSMDGGTAVTLTGSGFNGTRTVLIGGKPVTGFNIINDSQLSIITPPSSLGPFPVSITNAYGEGGSLGPSTSFQYVLSQATTTTAIKTAAPAQGSSHEGDTRPAVSFPATSPVPAAATASAASGTRKTPGFEAIAGLSALGAVVLLGKICP
ncbi:IPT/TIG domain-containing protein [uncultured Methanoregula sp.]|uniref:IPT/TIG domain-containing protein n=1 Tax=uncultured Methanoregula sp. TaxID=1005933 RepID=UPI002AAB4494|nr:IPT/TIG domain-containing protein [uncultured Methanoregula sp.]